MKKQKTQQKKMQMENEDQLIVSIKGLDWWSDLTGPEWNGD